MPFLAHALRENPDALALEDATGSLSYRELHGRAEDVARRLMSAGVAPGDLVAVDGSLGLEGLTMLHGVWLAGAAVAPLSRRWTPSEVEGALGWLRPRISVSVGDPRARDGREASVSGPIGSGDGGGAEATRVCLSGLQPSSASPPGLGDGDLVAKLLTSGTSGQPKVVDLTAGNLLASARASRQRLGLEPSDRWLASLSPAHVGGLALITRAAALGSVLVLRSGFTVETFLALADEGAVTHASLVPTMLHRTLETMGGRPAPASLRCILLGGAPAPKELLERALAAGFPVALTYGLTEASSQVATASPELVRRKPGTVGPPLPGVEVSLTEDGELLVRGPTVAPGCANHGGWLRTGDLARMDREGHLWILGRIADRIISGGVNVDPAEVEAVLAAHPGIREAAVVGLPDSVWGERVVAAVVPVHSGRPSAEDLDERVREALSGPKRPRLWRFVEALPRNANGKVDRERVRTLFR
jgi:o-succinylbenzoate---CoA ligase